MFSECINIDEFSRGVFMSNEDFSSVSLSAVVAQLVDCHIQAADRSGPIMSPESPSRWYAF